MAFSQYIDPEIARRRKDIKNHVAGLGDGILDEPLGEIVDGLVANWTFAVPTLRIEDAVVDGNEEDPSRTGLRVWFLVPFDGKGSSFDFQPTSLLMVNYGGVVTDSGLRFMTMVPRGSDPGVARQQLAEQAGQYQVALDQLHRDTGDYESTLRDYVTSLVEHRRQAHSEYRAVLAGLNVPVRRREDAVIPVNPTRRVAIPPPQQSPEGILAEPLVEDNAYADILSILRAMGRSMERTPQVFSTLGEEDLRNILLVGLNAVYEGDALGETFNVTGKTDILIRRYNANVFIAECKIWDGPAKALRALNQLLGYLGPRDAKTSLIFFVRGQGLDSVLSSADAVVQGHERFLRTHGVPRDLERQYVLFWGDDRARELRMDLMLIATPPRMA